MVKKLLLFVTLATLIATLGSADSTPPAPQPPPAPAAPKTPATADLYAAGYSASKAGREESLEKIDAYQLAKQGTGS